MTIVNHSPTTKTACELLEEAPFEFHLTGSRFFGGARVDSDWDFFVQAGPEVVGWLDAHGFRETDGSLAGYNDPNISIVFERDDTHVQVVKDAKLKLWLQDLLNEVGVLNKNNSAKMRERAVWTTLYEVVMMVPKNKKVPWK